MDIKSPENFTVIDGYSLASPFERIISLMIDLSVYAIIFTLLYIGFSSFQFEWLSGIIAGLYLLFRDSVGFLKYQSIGKKIMKLKVINNHDSFKITIIDAFKRNFIFLPNLFYAFGDFAFAALSITLIFILIETYLLYTSTDHQRLGDQFADTVVIENYL